MDTAPQEKKRWNLHALAFLEVGIFEFVFVAVVLFLLFGILNYFNILPVSDVFPQLSFLPRQSKQAPKNFTPISKILPTPTGFQYDVKKAEKLLTQYIKDTIKPEFLPAKIEVKQGLSIDGKQGNTKYEFGSQFTVNKDAFSSNFHYKENTNDSNDFTIFIQPKAVEGTTATVSLANSLLVSYFINPFPISSCQTKGTTSYCENFQALNDKKIGYGIVLGHEGANLIPIVFNCFVPKESKDYNTQQSCITP